MKTVNLYITYSWEERSEALVNEIKHYLDIPHVRVLLDKDCIHYRDSIEQFMDELRHGDIVVMVLSNQYLHSENCIYEMSGFFCDGKSKEKVFPLMVDANIRNKDYYLGLLSYWNKELDKLKMLLRSTKHAPTAMAPFQRDVHKIEEGLQRLPLLFEFCRDIMVPSIDEMRRDSFRDFVNSITRRVSELRHRLAEDTEGFLRIIISTGLQIEDIMLNISQRFRTNCSKLEAIHFDGDVQPNSQTFELYDSPAAIYAVLQQLQEEVGEKSVTNIHYSSPKHRMNRDLRTISQTLKMIRNE